MSGRIKGKSLRELGFPEEVMIYRAVDANVNHFNPMDYVTRSLKFAKGHADHNLVVQEEPQQVIAKTVKSSDVFEASNPGEYFYNGPEVKGFRVYLAK